MALTAKNIIKITVLPGIWPRAKNLFGSGFGSLAYLIAYIYNLVRILPNHHPFLKPENKGQYSIRQVIGEAANHIHPSRQNIDQIIIFFSIIAALFILVIQFLILFLAVLIPKANAQATMPDSIAGFFVTPSPRDDVAYRMLDLVFGVPGMFNSKDFAVTNFHTALHSLFEFYSYGMLIVGAMILIYFVVAVVAETAQSGIPFGQRFEKTWAPIRVILFFALLIPVSNGLNGAQYLTLSVAKLGSGLASTGWVKYNEALASDTPTGRIEQNVAIPHGPNISSLPSFMLIAKTCQKSYNALYDSDQSREEWNPATVEGGVRAWAVYKQKPDAGGGYIATKMLRATFQNLSTLSASPAINLVFGVKSPEEFSESNAGVFPLCGQLTFHITDVSQPGSAVIQAGYYDLIKSMWLGRRQIGTFSKNFMKQYMNIPDIDDPTAPLPAEEYKEEWLTYLDDYLNEDPSGIIPLAVQAQITLGQWDTQEVMSYGWGGAGIWYNKVAEQNGALVSALYQMPAVSLYPDVMERAKAWAQKDHNIISEKNQYTGAVERNTPPLPEHFRGDSDVLITLNHVYNYWEGAETQPGLDLTKNPIIDVVNVLLGTGGLFEMCKNTDVHPLAQLSSVGRSMLETAIRSYVAAGLFSIVSIIPNPFSGATESIAGMFGTIGSIGLMIGFILFYVVPFLPFLYFFFAVGGWVKGIFEAMVAMPLWALAHLRIDGDGIPGEAAIQGYYLLFEIFLRPILIVFGLIAAITIFATLVKVLNDIFYLAIANLAGHESETGITCFIDPAYNIDPSLPEEVREHKVAELEAAQRGPIDEFFYTILYTIVIYMTGMACFKLIDHIPNDILRWFNAEVPSFNDKAGDPAQGLVKYIALGGSQFGEQIGSSIGGVGKGLQKSSAEAIGFLGGK